MFMMVDEMRHLDHAFPVIRRKLRHQVLSVALSLAASSMIVHAPEVISVRHRRKRAVEWQNLQP